MTCLVHRLLGPKATVGLLVVLVNRADLFQKLFIPLAVCRRFAIVPVVVAAATDLEH